ncbi:MAG: Hsp20/alpha crystallin family protein [Promethearchaeota archaeon]
MTEVKEKKVDIKKEEVSQEVEKAEPEKTEETKEEQKGEIEVRRPRRAMSLFSAMDRFFNEMTRWFDEMFWRPMRLFDFEPFSMSIFDEDEFFRTPLANITEDDKAYHIRAELPGLDKGDIEITIHDGTLEIKGERKEEHEEKDEGYVRKEYHSSSYYRCFKLPENIDEDKIEAKLDKGVLTLDLPKKEIEEKEKKKIEVK